jgi:hypothetical protein
MPCLLGILEPGSSPSALPDMSEANVLQVRKRSAKPQLVLSCISGLKLSVSGQDNYCTSQLARPHLVTEVCGRNAASKSNRTGWLKGATGAAGKRARHLRHCLPASRLGLSPLLVRLGGANCSMGAHDVSVVPGSKAWPRRRQVTCERSPQVQYSEGNNSVVALLSRSVMAQSLALATR